MHKGTKPRTTIKKKLYFDEAVEQAVKEYIRSDDQAHKNKLFEEKIYPAFQKIAENVSNIFGAYRIKNSKDIIDEIVVSLLMNIHKYNPDSESKAFSYFTVAAKNYVFQAFKQTSAKRKFWDSVADKKCLEANGLGGCYSGEDSLGPEATMERKDFISGIILNLSGSIVDGAWTTANEVNVVRAVISLLEDNIVYKRDLLPVYSRKGIYIYLREMTNLETKHIARVMGKVRKKYAEYKHAYDDGEFIPQVPMQIVLNFSSSNNY